MTRKETMATAKPTAKPNDTPPNDVDADVLVTEEEMEEMAAKEAKAAQEEAEAETKKYQTEELRKKMAASAKAKATTHIFRSVYDKMVGVKVEDVKFHFTFHARRLVINSQTAHDVGYNLFKAVEALRALPDYGTDFLLVKAPGLKMTPDIEAFRDKTEGGTTGPGVVRGARSTGSGGH